MKNSFTSDAIGFVHCDMLLVDENGTATGYWQSQNISPADTTRFFLKIGTPFNNASMLMRKELFREFTHDTSLRIGSDSDMVFSVTNGWESVHVPEPLYIYRRHSNNLTKRYDYDEVAAHVRKFLSSHSLKELVPEVNWGSDDADDNQARAYAIISLLLARRGMKIDADEWLEKANSKISSPDCKLFVRAMSLLQNESYELARQILRSSTDADCIVDNYLGEIAAITGDSGGAFDYFLSASVKNPYYLDPIDNLRSLGGVKNMQLVDTTWLKYKQIS
jgi:hypothetical protein